MSQNWQTRKHSAIGSPKLSHEFTAEMIAPACDPGANGQGCFVARAFELANGTTDAILRISALGLYRAFLNGKRIGQDLLTPGWTCYDDRIAYQSYDVTSLLQAGENRLEIWLGDGWYRSRLMWALNPISNTWGTRTGAIAEIHAAGALVLKTDAHWSAGLTPVMANGIYYGEDYDARIAPVETAGVEILPFDRTLLVPHEADPVRELAAVEPIETWREGETTIYDFGQNCGAYASILARGPAGATVRVVFSEVLGPDRSFDNRNYRSARAEQNYVLKGDGEESWAPMFTFFGFRYARVTLTGGAEILALHQVPITSIPEMAGGFTCGVPEVNQLVMNTIWSQRSNFIEVPTDCPQRDERLGWTGDAQVFAGAACWLADCERFLAKYLRDVRHDQRPNGAISHFSPDPTRLHPINASGDWAGSTGWGDAIVIIPWQLYLHYGNPELLRESYPAMRKWLDYLWNISNGPIIRPDPVWGGRGFTFGDWLQPTGDNRKPRPTIADDCAATLYHFISTDLTARIAAIIGHSDDASFLSERASAIRAAFADEYFSASGRIAHNDQTSWALAFLYDLVPEQHREAGKVYFRRVVEEAGGTIGTGFIGTPALLPALTKLGLNDVAEKVFLNRRVPGWLYQVERGATSIWERWDALGEDGTIYDPDMNSYNHYAYGAVCQWLFESIAGVAPAEQKPGFDEVVLDPQILPALSPVDMWHDCRHGRIEVSWELNGETVCYRVSLPENMTGRLVWSDRRHAIKLNGVAVSVPATGLILGEGRHELTFEC